MSAKASPGAENSANLIGYEDFLKVMRIRARLSAADIIIHDWKSALREYSYNHCDCATCNIFRKNLPLDEFNFLKEMEFKYPTVFEEGDPRIPGNLTKEQEQKLIDIFSGLVFIFKPKPDDFPFNNPDN